MNPDSVDFKIVGGLVATVGSLVGVLIWLVKSSLPKLLETYRADILSGQQHLKDSLDKAEKSLVDARKEFLAEIHSKRVEYVQALKDERAAFIVELDKRDRIVERLAGAVETIASRVNELANRIEDCTIHHQEHRRHPE